MSKALLTVLDMFKIVLRALDSVITSFWFWVIDSSVDKYYERLTRESLRDGFRHDLLDLWENGQDEILIKLGQVKKKTTANNLGACFERFAKIDKQTGLNVWGYDEFEAFLSWRLETDHTSDLATIMWRSFCFTALFPYGSPDLPLDIKLELPDWITAVAILAARAIASRNRSAAGVFSTPRHGHEHKDLWRRFKSFAIRSVSDEHHGDTPAAQHQSDFQDELEVIIGSQDEHWRPPTVFDEMTMLAGAQLPLPYVMRPPSPHRIKARIQRLTRLTDYNPVREVDYSIPYEQLQALCAVSMQVHVLKRTDSERGLYKLRPTLETGDTTNNYAIAASLLRGSDIEHGHSVSYEQFITFSKRAAHRRGIHRYSFIGALNDLWQALFLMDENAQIEAQYPPTAINHALDYIYPQAELDDIRDVRRSSKLSYASTTLLDSLSAGAVIKAFTKPYTHKYMIIYGTTSDPSTGLTTTAIMAVMTCSPLWFHRSQLVTEQFRIGEGHAIMQLAPFPRLLCYSDENATYDQIVSHAGNAITFGAAQSGLSMDFAKNEAILSWLPGTELGYCEQPPMVNGPDDGESDGLTEVPWKTTMTIQRIEVYSESGPVTNSVRDVDDDDGDWEEEGEDQEEVDG